MSDRQPDAKSIDADAAIPASDAASVSAVAEVAVPNDAPRAGRVDRRQIIRALVYDKAAMIAAIFLVVVFLLAVFAPWVAPYDPLGQNLVSRNMPPLSQPLTDEGARHWLGTDALGRDTLSRIIYGARVSVSVGLIGATLSGLLGITLGVVAGFYRGRVDDIIMRLVDGMMAVPSLLVALFVLFILGGGLVNLIVVFALVRWMIYARVVRGMTLSFRESGYVEAARAIGSKNSAILWRHVWPNVRLTAFVVFTLEVAILILGEAALSFLGFGVQPPTPSWGNMITGGRDYIRDAWWLVMMPGLAIFLTVLSLNLLATWLRNVTDPTQQWRWLKVDFEE